MQFEICNVSDCLSRSIDYIFYFFLITNLLPISIFPLRFLFALKIALDINHRNLLICNDFKFMNFDFSFLLFFIESFNASMMSWKFQMKKKHTRIEWKKNCVSSFFHFWRWLEKLLWKLLTTRRYWQHHETWDDTRYHYLYVFLSLIIIFWFFFRSYSC